MKFNMEDIGGKLTEVQAERFKNLGNDEYQLGNFQKSVDFYTKAIKINDTKPTFFTNRALAQMKLS